MFVGHLGAGLLLKRADRRMNLGVLFFAVMFLDFLLWVLVVAGIERVIAPPDFAAKHYFTFVFPYSHGLAASIVWSCCGGVVVWTALGVRFKSRARAAVIVAAAVFSHFIVDALVHVPELPLLGEASPKLGLSLWENMPLALGVELASPLSVCTHICKDQLCVDSKQCWLQA